MVGRVLGVIEGVLDGTWRAGKDSVEAGMDVAMG